VGLKFPRKNPQSKKQEAHDYGDVTFDLAVDGGRCVASFGETLEGQVFSVSFPLGRLTALNLQGEVRDALKGHKADLDSIRAAKSKKTS